MISVVTILLLLFLLVKNGYNIMEDFINWFSDPIYTKIGKYVIVILCFR